MKPRYYYALSLIVAALFGIYWALDVPKRSANWTGFYYRGVSERREPVSFILRNPDMRSQVGAFETLEACERWAKGIRAKQVMETEYATREGGVKMHYGYAVNGNTYVQDDLFYCARNCAIREGAGGDCQDKEGVVSMFGKSL